MRFNEIRSLILAVLFVSLLLACTPAKNSLAQQTVDPTNANPTSSLQQTNQTTPTAVVKTQKANLREKPSRSGKVLTTVERDDRLVLLRSTSRTIFIDCTLLDEVVPLRR